MVHAMTTSFGARMLELMGEQGLSLSRLAKQVHYNVGYLSKISRDLKRPSEEIARRLDEALDAGGSLEALMPPRIRAPRGGTGGALTGALRADGDAERRVLLQLAALGVGANTLAPLLHLIDLALLGEPRDVDEWQTATADHLHALRTRPPARVRDDLLIDLVSLRRQMTTPGAQVIELQRVLAALSILQAHALTRLGEHGAALRTERIARHAADASGDLDLRLLVRCEEAGLGLYGQRDPATVLLLTESGQRIAGDSPFWLAHLACTQAKALTLLGRHDEAKRALGIVPDALPAPLRRLLSHHSHLVNGWTDDRSSSILHFARSWVHAGAGDEAAADEARTLVLGRTRDYQYAANVHLHEALCTVTNGGIDTGARQATEILTALPAAQHSQMITETGKTVLRAVPIDQWQRPAVRELRASVLAGPAETPR
jgi:transcriptional regulator with XRE-family HTH domain